VRYFPVLNLGCLMMKIKRAMESEFVMPKHHEKEGVYLIQFCSHHYLNYVKYGVDQFDGRYEHITSNMNKDCDFKGCPRSAIVKERALYFRGCY